jgi:alanine-glyoxylate transaminase/serine-glyoxylate transaminase/serine-pyruvate transaminase
MNDISALNTLPVRILMGPGPSNVHPRVLKAMATPVIGHLDPAFLRLMDEVRERLRLLFKTQNRFTIAVSGTGSAGMETALVNMLEPGDRILVGVAGVFGERMCDVASRCGAEVVRVEAAWGDIIEPEKMKAALQGGKFKTVSIVHAETSTGAHQPIKEIAEIAHQHGALLIVDTVTSLAGVEVSVDDWGIDVCYSGTQKCISCPPGLAPITFNERAMEVVRSGKTKVQSWYLDMTLVERYWGEERFYHHTAPISMIYALAESLSLIMEEGLEARWARHTRLGAALQAGLEAMGLPLLAREGFRLPMLTSVGIPEGVEDMTVRRRLLSEYNIEIGGGLGAFKGKAWRIGLMGESCTEANILLLLSALESLLRLRQ